MLDRIGPATLALLVLGFQAILPAAALASSPHLPTEGEVDRRYKDTDHAPDGRGYQAHSTESFMSKTARAAGWVKARLASIHVTPARLGVGLGAIGLAVSWTRNKRIVKWAVIASFSWLLLAFGVAAMIFAWPYMN